MEENKDMLTLLEKVLQPVFCVKNGTILHANAAARQMFLEPGMEIIGHPSSFRHANVLR